MDEGVRDLTGTLAPPTMRGLDALHVATAVRAGSDDLITYDGNMAGAASAAGVRTLAP